MRATRALAPHDPKLNDLRWLSGELLRRLHLTASLGGLKAVQLDAVRVSPGPRGLPLGEIAANARDKLRAVEIKVGRAAWPILICIVIEGGSVRDCRYLIPELMTPWRVDAVITDRLRVALDAMGYLVGYGGHA